MAAQSTDSCSWCGEAIEPHDGWRLHEVPGARKAAFCRLEHVVPWSIQGARWEAQEIGEAGQIDGPGGPGDTLDSCARCGAPLSDVRVVIVRHRGPHRIPDGFCSVDHMAEWAKSGGRYG